LSKEQNLLFSSVLKALVNISFRNAANRARILGDGVAPALLLMVKEAGDGEVQLQLMRLLANLTFCYERGQAQVCSSGLLPPLVLLLMRSSDQATIFAGASALCNVAHNEARCVSLCFMCVLVFRVFQRLGCV
jgi:hypothetical protein